MRLWRARRGNVALVAALLALPLTALVGLAIDFGSATLARARLDAAADAAALLATTVASNRYLAGSADPVAAAKAAAVQRFQAQAGAQQNVVTGPVAVSVTQSGTLFTSTVTYHGAYQTYFGTLVGVASIALGGASASSLSVNPFVDIQVLMDVSSSMTIAATQADINSLQALTAAYRPTGPLPGNVSPGEACAFACHWSTAGIDYLALAQRNNVTLRIDVLRSAVANLIANIAALNQHSAFRLGLSTFAQRFTAIYPTSGNVGGASAALAQIAPDINDCSNNCPETYFSSAMGAVGQITGASGNGASQATSQKFLFIVTDGLVDEYSGGSRKIGPVNPDDCAALKARGVTILTLYTPYLPLTNNGFYNTYVAPIQSQIVPHLQSCATSPSLAFEADNAADIDAKLRTMLATVIQNSGHLTR